MGQEEIRVCRFIALVDFRVLRRGGGRKTIILSDDQGYTMAGACPSCATPCVVGSLPAAVSTGAVPSD